MKLVKKTISGIISFAIIVTAAETGEYALFTTTASAENAEESVSESSEWHPILEEGTETKVNILSDDETAALISQVEKNNLIENDGINEEGLVTAYIPDKLTGNTTYSFSSDYFYKQMTAAEKEFYDRLRDGCESFLNSDADYSNSVLPEYITFDADELSDNDIRSVYGAFYYSNPQYYFLSNGFSQGAGEGKLYIFPSILSEFTSFSKRKEYSDRIKTITDLWMPEIEAAEGDSAKEKVIYEKLIDHIEYGAEPSQYIDGKLYAGLKDQTIAGAIADGLCVCNGYALAMSYFCNAVGIENVVYVSWIHAWNVVKLDGEWVHIDLTWMDGGSFINELYCNTDYDTLLNNDWMSAHVCGYWNNTGWSLPLEIDPKWFAAEDDGREYDENGFLINARNELVGYRGKGGDIVIPDGVISIENCAFENCTVITGVIMPDSVISIGSAAFKGCSHISKITFSSALKSIEGSDDPGGAFEGCTSLINVNLPDNMEEIGVNAFKNCVGLKEITIGNNVNIIEHGAFSNCDSLETLFIPDSVTELGIISDCDKLKSIRLSRNLVSLDGLHNCKAIEYIELPDSVLTVNNGFSGCSSLKNIKFGNGIKKIGAYDGCSSLESIVIPDTVVELVGGAFYNCTSLNGDITIPESVTTIGNQVFSGCSSLDSVKMNKNIDIIDFHMFSYCSDLKSVIFDDIKKIDEGAFWGCKSLQEFTIPGTVTEIGWAAFYECSSLKSLTISDGVKIIGSNAFMKCSSLSEIELPDSIIEIGDFAFCETSISSINLPASLEKLGENVFFSVNLETLIIPASCSEVNGGTFSFNYWIKNIEVEEGSKYYKSIDGVLFTADGKELVKFPAGKIEETTSYSVPDGVEIIGAMAFEDCSFIKNIMFPASLKSIEAGAFHTCGGLKEIVLPDNLEYIGVQAFSFGGFNEVTIPSGEIDWEAFWCCFDLEHVVIGAGVTKIGDNPFRYCGSLKSIDVDPENKYFKSIDGVLFTADGKKLISYPLGKSGTTYTVPEETQEIGAKVFNPINNNGSYTQKLDTVILCEGLKTIGDYAFDGLETLENINIPTGNVSVGAYAFRGCTSITEIIIPDSVSLIGKNAFEGCTGLINVTLSNSISYIPEECFKGCSVLSEIKIPDGIKTIDSGAFKDCSKLGSVVFGKNLKAIVGGAFANCVSIKSLALNEGLRYIYDGAFSSCTALETISLPSTLTKLYGIVDCPALTDIYYNDTLAFWKLVDKWLYPIPENVNINCKINAKPPVTGLTVSKISKNKYKLNEEFDDSTGEVTVTYSGGSTDTFAIRESMLKGFDTSTAGKITVTVNYEDLTDSFTITVYDGDEPDIDIAPDTFDITDTTSNIGGADISSEGELTEILTSKDSDADHIKLVVEENKSLTSEIENTISEVISKKSEVGLYLKIDLKKYVGTSESGTITETAKPVEIRMELPTALKKTDCTIAREYSVVRIHDGAAEILEVNFDGVNISFLTDRFSDYAIVYTDLAYGDVNGDGSVTLHDLLRLGKNIAGVEGTFIYKAAADVNADGKVTLHDLLRLGKSIAGIEGVVLGQTA